MARFELSVNPPYSPPCLLRGRQTRVCGVSLGRASSTAVIDKLGEYACGALGRETPQPLGPGSSPGQALTTPRDGRVVNKAG